MTAIARDYTRPNPPTRIIDAVAGGDIDVALVWGLVIAAIPYVADPARNAAPNSSASFLG